MYRISRRIANHLDIEISAKVTTYQKWVPPESAEDHFSTGLRLSGRALMEMMCMHMIV